MPRTLLYDLTKIYHFVARLSTISREREENRRILFNYLLSMYPAAVSGSGSFVLDIESDLSV